VAIAKDKTGLKKGRERTGIVPVQDPVFIDRLMVGLDHIMREERGYGETDERPMAVQGADHRHSNGAGCARATSYRIQEIPPTNPPAPIDRWNMHLGTVIGGYLARAAALTMPGAEAEVKCSHVIERVGARPLRTAGHADLVVPSDPEYGKLCVEFKSQGGFAFKKHSGIQSTAEGPAWKAIVQGGLCATTPEVDADAMMVVDVAKELVSKPIADSYGMDAGDPARGFSGWVFDREYCERVTERELTRVRRIHEELEAGRLAPRYIDDPEVPQAARVVDPETGAWTIADADGMVRQAGNTWMCGYCWHRDQCIADGP
jgi:hypothetical protein